MREVCHFSLPSPVYCSRFGLGAHTYTTKDAPTINKPSLKCKCMHHYTVTEGKEDLVLFRVFLVRSLSLLSPCVSLSIDSGTYSVVECQATTQL